ncbi:MAG: hypothetical protein ACYDEJ_16585 [Desulfitobacteriaceae bacterium]
MVSSSIEAKEITKQLGGIVKWLEQRPYPNNLILHLIELLGATLAGVKPAEILTLSVCTDKARNLDWQESYTCLSQHKEFKLKDIRLVRDTKQILFYREHSVSLEKKIKKPQPHVLAAFLSFFMPENCNKFSIPVKYLYISELSIFDMLFRKP